MSSKIVATHFARIKSLFEKQDILNFSRIVNIDESEVSLREMNLGRSKCIVAAGSIVVKIKTHRLQLGDF